MGLEYIDMAVSNMLYMVGIDILYFPKNNLNLQTEMKKLFSSFKWLKQTLFCYK